LPVNIHIIKITGELYALGEVLQAVGFGERHPFGQKFTEKVVWENERCLRISG
jgi:hypothetical protein